MKIKRMRVPINSEKIIFYQQSSEVKFFKKLSQT